MNEEILYAVVQHGRIVDGKQEVSQTLINANKIPSLVVHLPSYSVLLEHVQNERVKLLNVEANNELNGENKEVYTPQPYMVYLDSNEFNNIIKELKKRQSDHPSDHIALIASGTSMIPVCLILPKK